MNECQARYRSHEIRIGATNASKALRVVGASGRALAHVVFQCIMAALDGAFEEDHGAGVCGIIPLLRVFIDFTQPTRETFQQSFHTTL